jgi:hypothetical protein
MELLLYILRHCSKNVLDEQRKITNKLSQDSLRAD